MGEKVKKYLRKVGFNKMEEEPRYVKRYIITIFASFAYAMISMACVVHDKASALVLFLNGICIFRIILKNTIESSDIISVFQKKIKRGPNLNVEIVKGNHYLYRSLIQIPICAISAISMITAGFDTKIIYVKALTIIIICLVFEDDLNSSCINLYNAGIEPLKSGL